MRAISVWNPWAWALVAGYKTVENRDWHLPAAFKGRRVLIHCGKHNPTVEELATIDEWAEEHEIVVPAWARRPVGGIVGSLVFEGDLAVHEVLHGPEWAFGERCWAVRPGSAVMFQAAIPCPGALGFFRVPDDIARRFEVQP